MAALSCTILIAGELGDSFDGAFAGLSRTHVAGMTELSGRLVDYSEFQGVLRQLMDLELEILSFTTGPSAQVIG